MKNKAFEDRCELKPQDVIKDLVSQTTKQAQAIHELNKKKEELETELKKLSDKILQKDAQILNLETAARSLAAKIPIIEVPLSTPATPKPKAKK